MNDYQEQILDHFHNPRNYGIPEWSPTHKKKLQNLSCGDEIEVFLLVENNIINKISFIGEGCSISIASASLLTEELKGKSLDFIHDFTIDKLIDILGIQLTTTRIKCANLALETTKTALDPSTLLQVKEHDSNH